MEEAKLVNVIDNTGLDIEEYETSLETEDLSLDNLLYNMYKVFYVNKEFTIRALRRGLREGYSKNGDIIEEGIKILLGDNEFNFKYIEIVKPDIHIKGLSETYIRLTETSKEMIEANELGERIESLYDIMEELDYIERHKYLDGYSLAIAQHSSLNHFIAIKSLDNICSKENIPYKYKHNETSFRINNRKLRVEFDLVLHYNKRDYGIEVECGTTSSVDMFKKIHKHNLLAINNNIFKRVIFASPNKETLDIVKAKVKNTIKEYNKKRLLDVSLPPLIVKYTFLNISSLNNKKTLRLYMNRNQR